MSESQDQGQAAPEETGQVEGQGQPNEAQETGENQEQTEGKTLTWEEHVAENKRIAAKEEKAGRNAERKAIAELFGLETPEELEAVAEALKAYEDENTPAEERFANEIESRDKAIAEKDETIASLTRQVRRSSFLETVGLPNPRAAWGYVLDGTVEVEWDDNHKPSNLEAVRKALKTEDATLFGNGSADGGRRGTSATVTNLHGSDLIAHAYANNNG